MKPTVPGRLYAQGLDGPRFESAVEVVHHLGCVQSQLHDMALWAVARRMRETTLADLQAAFDAGAFLRTHVLRPTWHLVAPSDLHWLLALMGPRVERLIAATNRSIGLQPDDMERGAATVVRALADGVPRTRAELAAILTDAGQPLTGQGVAHAVMLAEVRALVVNGPMRGKQHSYVPAPDAPPVPARDDLLADVARRYARGHGPFRDQDLAWWTSLTLTDSRRAVELAGLRPVDVPGGSYWTLDEPVESDVPRAVLLSNFDEYVSYARDPDDYARFSGTVDDMMRGAGLLLIDGRLAGRWSRAVGARRVAIAVESTPRVTAPLRRALEAESAAFGRFLGREPQLRIV